MWSSWFWLSYGGRFLACRNRMLRIWLSALVFWLFEAAAVFSGFLFGATRLGAVSTTDACVGHPGIRQ